MALSSPRFNAVLLLSMLAACATAPPPPPAPVAAPIVQAPVEAVSRVAKPLQLDDAKDRCADVAQRAPTRMKVERVEWVAEGTAYPPSWAARRTLADALPEHCRINGLVVADPDDVDALPSIAIELRLPSRWNGRFFGQGMVNSQEQLVEAFGRTAGAGGYDDNALSRGFAVLSSEAVRSAGATAAGTANSRSDAASALAAPVLAAKALIGAYYGKPPDRSYFVGCSEGGRDGLVFAQHWPLMFDGIVAVAPRVRQTDAALAAAWTLRRFMAVAPRAGNGQPILSRAFSTDQLFTVAQGILKQCDALDGAEDGLVMDMAACRFEPAVLQCRPGRSTQCLPASKLEALRAAMAGPHDAAGQALYAPWPWDPGVAAPGWRAWTLGQAGPGRAPDARHLAQTTATLRAAATNPPDPKLDPLKLDFNRALPRLQTARNADAAILAAPLAAFRQNQGKLLLVHGAADPVVSAWTTVAYQNRLNSAPGSAGTRGAADHARTFIVPGMNHCAGGPATDRFDALGAVVEWVERDEPPQRIEARGSAVLRDETRPLCPWPLVARYLGTGSLHDSDNYACR